MIFIVFFALIIIAGIGLNILDTNNLEKIENYMKAQNCVAVHYNRGQYHGVCENNILIIKNSFSVDISKPDKSISYVDIKNITIEDKTIKIISTKENLKLEFKKPDNATVFYKKVQNKL
ncbi:MAG: hypothetical protein HRT43_01755 [Campylobacteraceae bacterium]|nr:hypothetical protein [Campylobacteraceae bacterium]